MSILDAILEAQERTVRLSAESSDPIRDLAQYYADLLNTFLHGMVKEPSDLLDLAEQDLEGTPYKLKRDHHGFWQVVRATMMFSVMRRIIWLGAQRSPKGGITIQGKFYRGGQFIPGKVIAKASPEEKAKLEARKQQDDINAAERKQKRLKRGVDVAKLKATLDQHKSSLSARQMGNAKRAFHALKRHHGDAVFHRIEEIANILTEQLAANEGRDWLTTQLRSKIAGLSQMVEMAEEWKKPVQKARSLFSIIKEKGGLDPEQLKRNYGPESIKQEGLLGVTLKGGIGIDDMAATLVAEGHIVPPLGVNETDYLWEQLKAKAITLHDAGDYYEQQFEREYAEYVRQAQEAQISESDIAEAIRSGEEEGEIEGGQSEWFEAVGELAEESGDASFDFGANVEEEKPKEPWEMTTKDFDAAIIGKAEEMINSGDKKYRGKSGSLRALAEASAIMRGGRGDISHEALVKSAIKTGKAIPPEVMSEYPHLKKPHERTQAEYDKVYNQEESRINRRSSGIGTLANDPQPAAPGMTWGQWSRMNDVERALRQNKPVPPEVLADYPDLAAKYGKGQLPGGKADNIPDAAFPQDKLAQGTEHELEHTNDAGTAKEIAKDHLAEDGDYYEKLDEVESNKQKTPEEIDAEIGHLQFKEYGEALRGLSREESKAYLDWKNSRDRKKAARRRGLKGAKTRKRRNEEHEQRVSNAVGKRGFEASKAMNDIMERWRNGYVDDSAIDDARRELDAAGYAEHLFSTFKNQGPHTRRFNDQRAKLGSEENKESLRSIRESSHLPWQISYGISTDPSPKIISGAEIRDSSNNRNERDLIIYGIDPGTGPNDWGTKHRPKNGGGVFRLTYDRGDSERNKRARQLVWALGNGRAENVDLRDIHHWVETGERIAPEDMRDWTQVGKKVSIEANKPV